MQFIQTLLARLQMLLASVSDDQRGVTTAEYAVMLVLVALAVAAFGDGIHSAITGVFDRLVTALAP